MRSRLLLFGVHLRTSELNFRNSILEVGFEQFSEFLLQVDRFRDEPKRNPLVVIPRQRCETDPDLRAAVSCLFVWSEEHKAKICDFRSVVFVLELLEGAVYLSGGVEDQEVLRLDLDASV